MHHGHRDHRRGARHHGRRRGPRRRLDVDGLARAARLPPHLPRHPRAGAVGGVRARLRALPHSLGAGHRSARPGRPAGQRTAEHLVQLLGARRGVRDAAGSGPGARHLQHEERGGPSSVLRDPARPAQRRRPDRGVLRPDRRRVRPVGRALGAGGLPEPAGRGQRLRVHRRRVRGGHRGTPSDQPRSPPNRLRRHSGPGGLHLQRGPTPRRGPSGRRAAQPGVRHRSGRHTRRHGRGHRRRPGGRPARRRAAAQRDLPPHGGRHRERRGGDESAAGVAACRAAGADRPLGARLRRQRARPALRPDHRRAAGRRAGTHCGSGGPGPHPARARASSASTTSSWRPAWCCAARPRCHDRDRAGGGRRSGHRRCEGGPS